MIFPYRNIFIDGGGNSRFFLEGYLNKFPIFDKVYVFEPNPLFHDSYNGSNLILIKKCIWVSNCNLPFYLSNDVRQVGSSLIKDKLCRVGDGFRDDFKEVPIDVGCVDFSEWICSVTRVHDNVTLKLDIEGSEYEVLWKMIKDGSISRVKKLYIEFHKDHMGVSDNDHNTLIKELKSRNLNPFFWN